MSQKRIFQTDFIKLGFTSISEKGEDRPQCVICAQVLSNESLKLNKLKRHLETKHPSNVNKDEAFFQRHEQNMKRQRLDSKTTKGVYSQRDAAMASLKVAWHVARAKKPHSIAEELIKPAAMDLRTIMCGTDQSKKLESVPLSDDTISRRINDLSSNVKMQTLNCMKASTIFAIQLDETTDVSNSAQLMVYVRYIGESDIEEDFLMLKNLLTTTTGGDIFEKVNSFFVEENINWKNCLAVCTDGAPSMMG
jgi:zinc finger BED domain-containing protein 5/7/8/9